MVGSCEVEIAGIDFVLLAPGGVFWPAASTLFVADAHLGKEATFRRQAIPVPLGSTTATLQRISEMLERTQANHLLILGDLLHARCSVSADVWRSLDAFFHRHNDLEVRLIRGNHDASADRSLQGWPIEIVDPPLLHGPLALTHFPGQPLPPAKLAICGHIHPCLQLGRRGESERLACFWLTGRCLVLPAIGEFTGMQRVRPGADERAWAVVEDVILAVHTRHAT